MSVKHLVVRYFDTYQEAELEFDSKEEALEFVNEKNEELRNYPLTNWEYRGEEKQKKTDSPASKNQS